MGSPGKNTGAGCHFLLQRMFLDQGLNHVSCIGRQILYHRAMNVDSQANHFHIPEHNTNDIQRIQYAYHLCAQKLKTVKYGQKQVISSGDYRWKTALRGYDGRWVMNMKKSTMTKQKLWEQKLLKQNVTELIPANSLQAKSNTIPLFYINMVLQSTATFVCLCTVSGCFHYSGKNHMVYKA